MVEGRPLITIALVAVIASVAAVLVTASWEFSRDRIQANERARLLSSLSSVLSPDLLARDLNPVAVTVTDSELLGSEQPIDVFLPMDGAKPLAAIFASVAPDGYNAPIHLLVGIDFESGTITGVRAVDHRETPGLGDLIDAEKSDWILQFDGKSLEKPAAAGWADAKEDGDFDSLTGATITPRAVIKAVRNTLLYFSAHRDLLIDLARQAADDQARTEP